MAAMPSLVALAQAPGSPQAPVLAPLRAQAQEALQAGLTWPTAKASAWRHTRLAALAERDWQPSPAQTIAPGALADALPPCAAGEHRLVLVDGVPAWDLCQLPLAEQGGTYVADLAEGLSARPQLLPHVDALGLRQGDALAALNASRAHHGALVHVAAGAQGNVPLQLLFVHTGADHPALVQPRVLVVLEPQARATIRETHLGRGHAPLWTNAATDIALGEGSALCYAMLQAEAPGSQHLAHVAATVGRDAHLALCTLDEGAALSRRSLHVELTAPGAHTELSHISLGRRSQHGDLQSVVRHMAPHTHSQQNYRAAADGLSTAVFSGMVHILADAQKVTANQMSRALIISPGSQAILKPQLMILADDVKCAHGATVGQIDEDALFYLTSRGIDARAAHRILTFAFLADALAAMPERVRSPLMARACAWLGLDAAIARPLAEAESDAAAGLEVLP